MSQINLFETVTETTLEDPVIDFAKFILRKISGSTYVTISTSEFWKLLKKYGEKKFLWDEFSHNYMIGALTIINNSICKVGKQILYCARCPYTYTFQLIDLKVDNEEQ